VVEKDFQGMSELTLDDKGRITVPARHRDRLIDPNGIAGRITITKHPVGCLIVFPREVWIPFREQLNSQGGDAEAWRRIFVGSAVDLEIDSAQRVLVPPELRQYAQLDRKLHLLGMGARFELWDAALHEAHEATTRALPMPAVVKSMVF